jgi:endonuclease YncB( thermonuclease family)
VTLPLALLLLFLPLTSWSAELEGRVVRIVDGDTLTVLDATNTQHKVRLAGIDCPEKGQPFGQRAKQALSDYVFSGQVTVEWDKRDRYGRAVGKVLDGERDVNLALVRDGMCWWYRKYAHEQSLVDQGLYEAAEQTARKQRKGLWSILSLCHRGSGGRGDGRGAGYTVNRTTECLRCTFMRWARSPEVNMQEDDTFISA